MKRIEALKIILDLLGDELLITTTGMISREAFASKDRKENFYMLGSMGLVTPLALGVALSRPDKRIIGIEGDGSALLNLGSLAMAASEKPNNLLTVILDNGVYESTGRQFCISQKLDFKKIAESLGYKNVLKVQSSLSLKASLRKLLKVNGPNLLTIKVESSHPEGLPRISLTPMEIKERFREKLQ